MQAVVEQQHYFLEKKQDRAVFCPIRQNGFYNCVRLFSMKDIAIQSLLHPALTPVHGCKDYAVCSKPCRTSIDF